MNEVASEVWKRVKIGDAFDTVTGNTPSKSEKQFYGDAIPLVKPPELLDGDTSDASDGLSEEGRKVSRIAPEGSVLVSCIGNLGKIGLAARELAFNQQINAIMPDRSKADPKFVFYYCLSATFSEQLEALSSGTTVAIVNKSRFNSIEMPLPSLTEQKRIVAVLDQAFVALHRARANAEANLADSTNLLERELETVFAELHSAEPISTRFQTATGGTPPKSQKALYGRELRFVKPPELLNSVIAETNDGLSELARAKARIAPSGAVLVSCIGNLGKIGLLDQEAAFNQQINAILPSEKIAMPLFVFWQCRSAPFRRELEARSSGTTVSIVNKKQFNSIPFWTPSLSEQERIAEHLGKLEERVHVLTRNYRDQLVETDQLRQSILQKAFAGELT